MDLRDDAITAACLEPGDEVAADGAEKAMERNDCMADGDAGISSEASGKGGGEVDTLVLKGLELKGQLLREDRSEQDCRAVEMAPEHVRIASEPLPEAGERIVVYLDEIGRLEGYVADIDEKEAVFTLLLMLTRARQKKVKSALEWLRDKKAGRAKERRRHLRIEPTDGQSYIVLSDGRRYPCEVLDISLSGAAVRMDVLPAVGTYVTLGRMRGRVVRHHEHGIAIEFVKVADKEALRQTVRRL